MDLRDIIAFSLDGEKILGVVIEHYSNPLDDFYVVYADYSIYKVHSSEEDAVSIIDNVIIPSCDAALSEYRLKKQHISDMNKAHNDIEDLIKAISSKMNLDDIE